MYEIGICGQSNLRTRLEVVNAGDRIYLAGLCRGLVQKKHNVLRMAMRRCRQSARDDSSGQNKASTPTECCTPAFHHTIPRSDENRPLSPY